MSEDVIGKRVKIKSTITKTYLTYELVGKYGTVKRVSDSCKSRGFIGVAVDGINNPASSYGLFWFYEGEFDFVGNESEDIIMEGFKYVAIVNLMEDSHKKDYAFALHENDCRLVTYVGAVQFPAMVIVNPRNKKNRVLGTVKEIIPIKEYNGTKPTAEVVGVVNMNDFVRREAEKERQAELAKKRAAIEAEIEKEINKRKSIEYYEEMAKKYYNNPRLVKLVGELRSLGA